MATIHAWFSSASELRYGSMIYRKPDGSTVNVTRMNLQRDGKPRSNREGEVYVGEVIRTEDGGCVQPKRRVRRSATDSSAAASPDVHRSV